MSTASLLLVVGLPLGIVVIVVVILFRRRRPEPRGFDVVRRETPTQPDGHFK
jgi:hypothetical protein